MNGPQYLKRLVAIIGLLLMMPIGYQLIMGTVTPTDAAIRAGALFVGVVMARKAADLAPSGRTVLIPVQEERSVEAPAEG